MSFLSFCPYLFPINFEKKNKFALPSFAHITLGNNARKIRKFLILFFISLSFQIHKNLRFLSLLYFSFLIKLIFLFFRKMAKPFALSYAQGRQILVFFCFLSFGDFLRRRAE